jgi:arylsulfatase A-like enzyme
MILAALEKRNQLADTDVFVLSTHGTTTASKQVDIAADLRRLGIETRTELAENATPGSILLVTNGSGASLYITAHDATATAQTIAALRKLDYVGPLFTRIKTPGAVTLDQSHADTPDAPDILLSYRWTTAKNRAEVPSSDPGKGAAGSLAPHDLGTFMIALGPDFAPGKTDTLPTGNIDLAPTILWILGVEPPKTMNGRVLFEALTQGGNVPAPETLTLEERAPTPDGEWRQYLKIAKVGTTEYLLEGNADITHAAASPVTHKP